MAAWICSATHPPPWRRCRTLTIPPPVRARPPDALWDVAYYQGRYYVYFGIVPCLLFQLPFELLTGVPDLPPSLAMIVMAWLLILAVFGLVQQAAQRWFPSASAAALACWRGGHCGR